VVLVEVASLVIFKLKLKYGKRFNFYLTGSFARNEKDFKDYDIMIYDNYNKKDDWEYILKNFYNKKEKDGKPLDVQISQYLPESIKMTGGEVYKNRNKIVKRYVYSVKKLKNSSFVKYNNVYGNLWKKEVTFVSIKHKKMGLDKIKRIYVEL
tara:strand:+ start:47 stop:502 length:456 start_codon:yes stop_codon:yes gene_type:complete